MKNYTTASCGHKNCNLPPSAHGIERNRKGVQTSHPFILVDR